MVKRREVSHDGSHEDVFASESMLVREHVMSLVTEVEVMIVQNIYEVTPRLHSYADWKHNWLLLIC